MESTGSKKPSLGERIGAFFSGRRKLWVLLILAVVGIALWRGISFRKRMLSTAQSQTFRLAKVTCGPIEVTVTGTGTIKPRRRWELSTRSGGELTGVFVEPGQHVEEGQVLAQLETGSLLLNIDDAALELKQAEAALSDLENNLSLLTVKSESEGAITWLSARQGQSIREDEHICSITGSHMEVKSYFNKRQAQNIAAGQEAGVFFIDLLCEVPGTVRHVSQTGQAREGGIVLYPVTVEIENQGALIPGMPVVVEIDTADGVMKSSDKSNELLYVVQEVRAKTSGRVNNVFIAEGDRVEVGQVLLELEAESLERQIETQTLRVKRAENHLASLEDELASQTVRAPADGTVLDVRVQQGVTVGAGSVIAVVGDLSNMEVTLPIDEIDAGRVKPGQPATITADAVPGKQFPGTVSSISFEGKATAGIATFDAKVLAETGNELLSGMSCDVVIYTDSKSDTLLLPVEALQTRDSGYIVWVVPGLPEGETQSEIHLSPSITQKLLSEAKPVNVEVGLISSNYAEILSGLKEGDTVLVFSQSSGPFGAEGLRFRFP